MQSSTNLKINEATIKMKKKINLLKKTFPIEYSDSVENEEKSFDQRIK